MEKKHVSESGFQEEITFLCDWNAVNYKVEKLEDFHKAGYEETKDTRNGFCLKRGPHYHLDLFLLISK